MLDANQKALYSLFHDNKAKIQSWLLARRCLAEGTLIKTPTGLVAIQDLKVGDKVFGYNKDGTISIATVKETFVNGKKEVWDLTSGSRVLETCTKDHIWLTTNEYNGKYIERKTKDIKKYNKIVREWVPYGMLEGINEPHAYAIGALLGDGCSKQGTNKIYISSEDDLIPNKISKILNCKYYSSSELNYTWCLSNEEHKSVGSASHGSTKVLCNYYEEWCKDKYAHEKIANLDIIKSWNPESQLAFLAGIIDTDGSFYTSENCLIYRLGLQSYSVVEACQYIIHNLFQYKCSIYIDDREKYKNGPVYNLSVKNNGIVKKMLRALNSHLVTDRKKWKPDYEMFLENNSNSSYVGIKISNPRIMNTYDIHIDNDTNLYLTANGLVTHNSGKTYSLCVLAIEYCLKNPKSIIKYVAPTKMQVEKFIRPIITQILETCPDDIKPEYRGKDNIYFFSNGSEIQLCGAEKGNIDSIRGGFSHIAIVDEAQDFSDLKYAINSVLLPTTLTTRGKILISGTPPEDSEHDFIHFIEMCQARGTLIKRTIYDNPRLSKQDIDELIEAMNGEHTESFRRECMCEIVKSKTKSVVPEFTEEKALELVKDWKRPTHFNAYVGMDIGGRDWTVILFAYFDFKADKLIFEDELVYKDNNMYTPTVARDIEEKEAALWTNILTHEQIKPKKRVSDHNLIFINDIKKHSNYKIIFENADKKDKAASINFLRVLINNNKIVISPKCTTLIEHLKNVKWLNPNSSTEFARCPLGSHYDAVDAALYLTRAVDFRLNPYPKDYNSPLKEEDAFYIPSYNDNKIEKENVYKQIMGLKPKKSDFALQTEDNKLVYKNLLKKGNK